MLTAGGVVVAGAVPCLAGLGARWPIAAGLLAAASAGLDNLDGAVAVMSRRTSAWGYVLAVTGEDPGIELKAIERADREHLGCFLTTVTPENTVWYERFGFTIASEYRPTPRWPTVWAMWREPKA